MPITRKKKPSNSSKTGFDTLRPQRWFKSRKSWLTWKLNWKKCHQKRKRWIWGWTLRKLLPSWRILWQKKVISRPKLHRGMYKMLEASFCFTCEEYEMGEICVEIRFPPVKSRTIYLNQLSINKMEWSLSFILHLCFRVVSQQSLCPTKLWHIKKPDSHVVLPVVEKAEAWNLSPLQQRVFWRHLLTLSTICALKASLLACAVPAG